MPSYSYISLIPLLPLAGFVILGLFGRKYFKNASGIIGTGLLLISTVLALYTGYQYFFIDGKADDVYRSIMPLKYTWLQFNGHGAGQDTGVSIDMSVILDPISVMMIIVVTFVSLMVHVFSLGYMKGEERFPTYYAFLSLFTFSMLGLVLSGNLLQIFIFWELVGVSSYLLIGYYFDRPSAVAASKKAFVVTRLADLAFLIGILILAFYSGTLDFITLTDRLTSPTAELFSITTQSFLGVTMLSWALSLIFIGGAGKSAMFPLHIWLPDAMEGPTPVSALIHAATMVVAGVYLVARLFPVYDFAISAGLDLVTYIGAFSALLAAVIACTQTDIKRVLAYSTMSQIGFMMFALGVSGYGRMEEQLGYTASMFHLFTHAFFKSLLFLGAGAVIHMVHSNEMKDMGGLRKLMPITHICFLIACLAIAGIPPYSGFFSKEEILLAAFNNNKFVYAIGLVTSALTAFYMFRLYFSIFWAREPHVHGHHGEGTMSMKIPLIILAVCSALAGFVPFGKFVTANGVPLEPHFNIIFAIAPVALAVLGIWAATVLYKTENNRPAAIASSLGGLYRAAYKKFYIDEIYLFITKKVIFNLVGRPAAWIDRHIVDGFMNMLAAVTARTAEAIKGLQSGKVQSYAFYFFIGVAGLAVFFVLWYSNLVVL
ncbi:MAG TPA: NADH-quinone oxidoreductase subunit L [Chitinophagaceae bacterium]|nr:NADH-quinone oxidoreductase subunit L [Chitinophagaceae bacterium]